MNNEFERSTLLTDDYINAKSCGTFSFLLFIFFIKSPTTLPTHTLSPAFLHHLQHIASPHDHPHLQGTAIGVDMDKANSGLLA